MNQTTVQKITFLGIVMVLFGAAFYCYEFVLQVAPSVMTEQLMHDFSINATIIGSISGVYYYSYTGMQIPAGLIYDRYGARLVLFSVILICAVGALLFGYATNAWMLGAGRVLMGFGSAFSFVGALYLIIRWIPSRYFALFAGIVQFFSSLGSIGGGYVLAKVIAHVGWRHSLISSGFIGILLAVLVLLFLRNKPKNVEEPAFEGKAVFRNFLHVLKNPQTFYVAIYAFAIWAPIVAFAALWGVPFLKTSAHFTDIEAAAAMAMVWIGIAVSSPVAGFISDKIFRRCLPLTVLAVVGVLSMSAVIYLAHLSVAMIFILLFLIGVAAGGQTVSFGVVKDINPKEITSSANGLNNMAVVFGGMLFQPLIGKFLDIEWDGKIAHGVRIYSLHAYHIVLITLPLCFLLAAIMSIFFIKETYCKERY